MEDAALSAFSIFFTQSPSFLDSQVRMQKQLGQNNAGAIGPRAASAVMGWAASPHRCGRQTRVNDAMREWIKTHQTHSPA